MNYIDDTNYEEIVATGGRVRKALRSLGTWYEERQPVIIKRMYIESDTLYFGVSMAGVKHLIKAKLALNADPANHHYTIQSTKAGINPRSITLHEIAHGNF